MFAFAGNRSFGSLLLGIVLFAGGYWAGGLQVRRAGTEPAAAPRPTGFAQADAPLAADNSVPLAATGIRPFVPGRPFPDGGARDWVLSQTSAWERDKRGRALAFMTLLPVFLTMDEASAREAVGALRELIAEANEQDPQRRNNPNGDGKLDVLMEFALMRLTQIDPDQAVDHLRDHFRLNDGTTQFFVFATIADGDPQRAEELALSLPSDLRKDALESVFHILANQDPAAALALADRHPEMIGNRKKRLFEGWVRRDPTTAMNAAVQAMAQSGDSDLVRNTIEEWVKFDPSAAAQWSAAHEGAGSIVARAMVLETQARDDPHGALQEFAHLQQAGGTSQDLARLASALAASLASKDLPAAQTWAESLPAGDMQDRALQNVAKEWIKADAPAASEWILSLPAGAVRDRAAQDLASAIARRDPAGAFQWARSITDPSSRKSSLDNVLELWREMDPDAAHSALESLPPGQPLTE